MRLLIAALTMMTMTSAPARPEGTWTSYPDSVGIRDMRLQGEYLWCATGSGILRYNTRDMSKRIYTTQNGLPENSIYSIAPNSDGTVWATVHVPKDVDPSQWVLYSLKEDHWIHHPIKASDSNYGFSSFHWGPYAIETDSMGRIWLGSLGGMEPNGTVFYVNPPSTGNYLLPDEYLVYLERDGYGTLWAATYYYHHMHYHAYFFRSTPSGWAEYFLYNPGGATSVHPVVAGRGSVVWLYETYILPGDTYREEAGLVRYDGSETTRYPYPAIGIEGMVTCGCFSPDGSVWFGTDTGMVCRFDGNIWKHFSPANGVPFASPVKSVRIAQNGIVWVGTDKGLSRYIPEKLSIGESASPTTLFIRGNTPNPFNPSTSISFILPRGGKTTLAIYNATGQKVRTLISGITVAGSHSVMWNGRDDSGRMVSSGVYIANLRAGNAVASRKMLLMK